MLKRLEIGLWAAMAAAGLSVEARSEQNVFTINNGASCTGTDRVLLTVNPPEGVTAMKISNDGGGFGSIWEPVAPTREWRITTYKNLALERTVYLWLASDTEVLGQYWDRILYDPHCPLGRYQLYLPMIEK